jgi:Ca2+:H+ antiporter
MRFKMLRRELFLWWMLIFVPISFVFSAIGNQPMAFITSLLAIVPLAQMIGLATRELAIQTNPSISGLVSATFGNLIELIIAITALRSGLIRVVQASLVGSIIGNILLLVGLSIFFGGLKYKHQHFNKEAIGVSSTMLLIVLVGMTIPSVYAFVYPAGPHLQVLSDLVAGILALIYLAGLVFSLRTHKDMFDASDEIRVLCEKPFLTKKAAATILLVATVLAALESELLVKGIEKAALSIGISYTFIGVVIIAIITNIAEKSAAVTMARKNQLNVSIEIGLSSAIQIALFVVPILVFLSQLLGYGFTLTFSVFEVMAIMLAVLIVNDLAADGRCNWLEGAQLMAVYFILATAFFFI